MEKGRKENEERGSHKGGREYIYGRKEEKRKNGMKEGGKEEGKEGKQVLLEGGEELCETVDMEKEKEGRRKKKKAEMR